MSKVCCEWHEHLPEVFAEDVKAEDCYGECGLAGMGTPSVCCRNCEHYDWFVNRRGVMPYVVKEIMSLPVEERP